MIFKPRRSYNFKFSYSDRPISSFTSKIIEHRAIVTKEANRNSYAIIIMRSIEWCNVSDRWPRFQAHDVIQRQITRKQYTIERAWLKEYIDLNTELRTDAKNNFEKDFFKLMNNCVFGKTIENIENRVDIKLVTDKNNARKLAAKPNYDHCTIFDENLVAIHMTKTKIYYNKPVYLGMCILDLSKTLMYDFHYNYMKPKYGSEAKLLYTDTDSLIYEIGTEDCYKDIAGDLETLFDTSEFDASHPSGIQTGVNKKVIGRVEK